MATPSDIFSDIDRRLRDDPARVAGMSAAYQFDLTGEDGGLYHLVIRNGDGTAGEGGVDNPNTTISMSAGDFVDMASGRLDPTMAYMSGKIVIRGDMGFAMKLQSLLRE